VNQVFVRSEHLAEKIYDVKLFMADWKVLFALDGKMSTEEISHFLEMDPGKVDQSVKQLLDLQLIMPLGAEVVPPETEKPTEEEFEVAEKGEPQEMEETELEVPEDEVTEAPEEVSEEVVEEELKAETTEEPEETAEPEVSEEVQEEISDEFETIDSSIEEGFEELKIEEEEESTGEKAEESEQDLDQLINDLLQEEGGTEESEEGQVAQEEELEEAEQAAVEEPEVETEPESETEEAPEAEERGDFDLGNIFDTDIAETEESIDEMLKKEDTEEAVAEEEAEVEQPPIPIPDSDKKTILVVDDSVVIRKMVEIALENENYNIITVANGKDAFSYLDEQDPDLVILDIMLPDVNGLDILKTIKASKEIPVVMISAKDTPKETNKAKELGANDFIPKPFRDEDLIKKIHELIGD
jgi:CheY-like chemotaxis protein